MEYDVALPPGVSDFYPRVKENICIIVVGLAIQDGKVLLIKEAKKSCRGQYFLPAGRLEPNETLIEGVRREVLEESGLLFEPRTCVLVEIDGPFWISITFLGDIVGGSIKVVPDSESLGAQWFSIGSVEQAERIWREKRNFHSSTKLSDSMSPNFVLRAAVMHMVDAGWRYLSTSLPRPIMLPFSLSHNVRSIIYHLAVVALGEPGSTPTISSTHVLLSGSRLPALRLNGGHPIDMIRRFISVLFKTDPSQYWNPWEISVLGVAVTPRNASDDAEQTDGLLMTLRIVFHAPSSMVKANAGYDWICLTSLGDALQPLVPLLALPDDADLLPRYLFDSAQRRELAKSKCARESNNENVPH